MAKGDRRNLVRSLVRSAVNRAAGVITQVPAVSRARAAATDLVNQRTRLGEQELSRALAHAPEVTSASVTARDGALALHATFTDGSFVEAVLTPLRLSFAPRGAKEIEFAITLGPGSSAPKLSDLVGALGEQIAAVIWSFGASRFARAGSGPPSGKAGRAVGPSAIRVDREGAAVRVDLRSSRAARQFLGTPLEPMIDVFELRALRVGDRALELDLGLPRTR